MQNYIDIKNFVRFELPLINMEKDSYTLLLAIAGLKK